MSIKREKRDRAHPSKEKGTGDDLGLGGILGGLGSLMEKLGDLAEKGEELQKLKEIQGDRFRGVVGFTIKSGIGGDRGSYNVEPFGNVGRDAQTGKATVREILEPVVDVVEENDHVLVVAEMPGIRDEDVKIELDEDILTIDAERGTKKYHKEVLLPSPSTIDKLTRTCRDGVFEIRLAR